MSSHPTQVLLIEDNPGDADFVRMRLGEGDSDLQVTHADRLATGLAALAIDPPSVVLLDLNLPDSRGEETFRNVLNKAPGVPVVILSGQDDVEMAANAIHFGVQEYLVKGAFDVKQLAHAVRFAIGRQAVLTALDISRKQQLQYKDQFLSHVSHELRTPLTCAHQFVSIVLDGLAGPISAEQRDHLETTLMSLNQLRTMIGGLLDATRAESGKICIDSHCIAIGNVLQQAGTMMQGIAKARRISLEVAVDDRLQLVFADPDRILQVLTNLIDNATKFTPANGSVRVTASRLESDPTFIRISVADSGQGIRPEAKALIFERLYQEANAFEHHRKGLGLGLYIVQELVRLHGGRVWVDSEVGFGSTFNFTLPVFPLSMLLLPVITEQGHLPASVALVAVELSSQWTATVAHRRDRWLDLLRSCVVSSKDVVLPSLGASGQGETFWIVASADSLGANILAQRIRVRLARSDEAKAGATFQVSVAMVALPVQVDKPLQMLVEEVADTVSGMILADIETQQASPKEAGVRTKPLLVELKRRKPKNGQTKDSNRG